MSIYDGRHNCYENAIESMGAGYRLHTQQDQPRLNTAKSEEGEK